MKIGLYSPYLDTMSGGERYMLSLACCLADKHEVTIFWDKNQEDHIRTEALRKFALKLDKLQFEETIFTPKTSFLARFNKTRDYDVVVILSDGSIPFLSCRTMLHFQSPLEWVNADTFWNRIKLRRISDVICNSLYTKRYIDRKFHVKSHILYPPVDLPPAGDMKKEKMILNLGRYGVATAGSSFKKQEIMRDVFSELVREGLRDWEMVFIMNVKEAEQESADRFIASVKDLPMRVVVNPTIQTVRDYYKKAAIYWHAAGFGEDLKAHPDRAEHFGLSTVEAMHYGAAPVVINAGGQPEIVTDSENGLLWETTDELKKKTKQIIRDDKLRSKLSEAAQLRAQQFTYEQFCEEAHRLIHEE